MAHSTTPLLAVAALAFFAACSGEVNTLPADSSDSGTGGTTATGGSGGGTSGSGGTGIDGGVGATGGGGSGGAGGSGGTAGTAGSGGMGGSGGAGGEGGAPPSDQEIFFEVSYENYAWSAQLDGIFVTKDGSVYAYDYFAGDAGTTMPPAASQQASEQEMRARWGNVTGPIAQVPANEVEAFYGQVDAVARGVLLSSFACADAGELAYLAYLYDPSTGLYTRVVAGIDGDMAVKNLAPAAEGIMKWLADLHGVEGVCSYQGYQCVGATCASTPPTCPDGLVPSVEGGCWGECVRATWCLEVPSCDACDGSVCATSESGTHHCSELFCSGPAPCDCSYSPCGGGSTYCTPASGLEVACGAK